MEFIRKEFTPEEILEFEELDHVCERVRKESYTNSRIPISPRHAKWLAYRQLEGSIQNSRPSAALGNGHVACQLNLPLTSLMAIPPSAAPSLLPNTTMDVVLGAATHSTTAAALASGPQSQLCTHPVMLVCPGNWPYHGGFLAAHPNHSSPIGAPNLAHGWAPAALHGHERISVDTAGTVPSVVDISPQRENGLAAVDVDEDDDDERLEDQAESESTQICLWLGNDWPGISADVYRALTDNWISEKLLRRANHVFEPSQGSVACRIPDGIRLESKGCVELGCRLVRNGKTHHCRFQVYASGSRAPDVILGKPWAQAHGASAVISRRSDIPKDRNAQRRRARECLKGNLSRKDSSSQSASGHRIMKLPQRHRIDRQAERLRR